MLLIILPSDGEKVHQYISGRGTDCSVKLRRTGSPRAEATTTLVKEATSNGASENSLLLISTFQNMFC